MARAARQQSGISMSDDCLYELRQVREAAELAGEGAHRVADALEPIGALAKAIHERGASWAKWGLTIGLTALISSGILSNSAGLALKGLITGHP